MPIKAGLEAAVPDNPVILGNDIRMALANAKALAALGITKRMARPPKGDGVLLGADGNPTGIITDRFAGIPGSPAPNEIAGGWGVFTRQ